MYTGHKRIDDEPIELCRGLRISVYDREVETFYAAVILAANVQSGLEVVYVDFTISNGSKELGVEHVSLERIDAGALKPRPQATDMLIGITVKVDQETYLVADVMPTTRKSAPKYLLVAGDGSHRQLASSGFDGKGKNHRRTSIVASAAGALPRPHALFSY